MARIKKFYNKILKETKKLYSKTSVVLIKFFKDISKSISSGPIKNVYNISLNAVKNIYSIVSNTTKNFFRKIPKFPYKKYLTKRNVMLLVSVILAISVCSSAVRAWFLESSSAKANVSADVYNFNFTTNGKFNQDIVFLADGTEGYNKFVYKVDPNEGMFPGQVIETKFILANKGSTWDAKYKITVDSMNIPKDCYIELKDSNDKGFDPWIISNKPRVYPTEDDYARLNVDQTNELTLTITWPRDYSDYADVLSSTNIYANEDEKNAGDVAFLKSCKDTDGTINKDFWIIFKIEAEQIIE